MIKELDMFDERKASDVAAYLLLKEEYGKMEYQRLMGLLYLSERKCIDKEGRSMCNAVLVSTSEGPVLSEVAELIKGDRKSVLYGWSDRINESTGSYVSVKKGIMYGDLDELCDAFIEIIEDVWEEVGDMKEQDLIEHIYNTCPECKYVNGNGLNGQRNHLIDLDELLKNIGYSNSHIQGFREQLEEHRSLTELFRDVDDKKIMYEEFS